MRGAATLRFLELEFKSRADEALLEVEDELEPDLAETAGDVKSAAAGLQSSSSSSSCMAASGAAADEDEKFED